MSGGNGRSVWCQVRSGDTQVSFWWPSGWVGGAVNGASWPGTSTTGRPSSCCCCCSSVMQGAPDGEHQVLAEPVTPSTKWWLRGGNTVMEGRDLYIRHDDLGFFSPKTFPLAVERRRRKPTFDKFPKFFSPGPSCRDVASVAPSRPILTQQFEGKVGHSTYILQRN